MLAEFQTSTKPAFALYEQPAERLFVRVLDSIEQYGVDRCTYNEQSNGKPPRFEDKASPDVWNYETGKTQRFVSLTEDIQHWMFRIFVEVYQGYKFRNETEYRDWHRANKKGILANWFTSILRSNGSHTNKSGFGTMFENVPSSANYIRGEDLQNDLPKLWHLVTGRFVGELYDDSIQSVYGAICRPIKCINISRGNYRDYHPFDTPEYFDQPMITGRYMVQDKGGVRITGYFRSPYGQFAGKAVLPVASPYNDAVWMPAKYLVEDGSKPLRKFG